MTIGSWTKIKKIFHEALERDPAARKAFLDKACRDAPELRAEVEAYLLAHEGAPSIIEKSIESVIAPLFDDEESEDMIGKMIGPYRLERELGRGGMGIVYLAYRHDGEYDKTVAIKLIKRGLDSDEIVARFRHERQTLASLEHPNIARLLEGGRIEKGRPFFIMEYVDGVAIDAFCEDNHLEIGDRLRLFQKVCTAVEYAHQNAIVHRDLKPSNILVTNDGEPKLLDFGIAKMISPDLSSMETQVGLRPMTLEYASPEQVRSSAITTLSDIYALGVLLYHLMTGHSPYSVSEAGTSEGLETAIIEQEPKKPSETIVLAQYNGDNHDQNIHKVTPVTASAVRESSSETLRRLLTGDLDSIVLKALRKEPQERYSSAAQLSSDIERHFTSQPVEARKGVWTYRTGRFVRRHKFAVGAAIVFMAMIVGFVISTQIQAQRVRRERDKAEQVSDFLVDIFQVSDPNETKGDTITAREILERGAQRITKELKNQPMVQATLIRAIAKVYQKLGLFARADTLFEAALVLRQQMWRGNNVEVAQSLNDLGDLRRERGDFASAEQLHREALRMRLELHPRKHRDVAESMNNLALVLHSKEEYDVAESLYREALAIQIKLFGEGNTVVVTTENNFASLLQDKGEYQEAEALFREVLAARRKVLGEKHHDVAVSLNNLALVLDYQGNYSGADSLYRQALVIYRALFGDKHPSTAICLSNLGSVSYGKGDYASAAAYFRQALQMQQELLGAEHPDAVTNLNNLAFMLAKQSEYEEAERLFRQVMQLDRKRLGNESPSLASSMSNLARILHEQNKYTEAELLLRETLEMRRKSLGDKHPSIATNLDNLASVLRDRGNLTAAATAFREALDMRRQVLGANHHEVAASLHNLADLSLRQGNALAADTLCRQALAMREQILPLGHPDLAASQSLLGMILIESGSAGEAELLLRQALENQSAALAEGHWLIANTESILGGSLVALQRYEEAESLLIKSCTTLKNKRGEHDLHTRRALRRLDDLYSVWGKPQKTNEYSATLQDVARPKRSMEK